MMHLTRKLPLRWVLLAIVLLVIGCDSQEPITRQRAPKPEPQTAIQRRTLGAIVLRDDKAWFFKVTGLDERVQNHEPEFREFVKKVRFDAAGNPEWNLPSGWRELPGSEFRYRTLHMSAATSPLELAVSSLPLSGQQSQQYLLENVNRWRNQLALPPITAEQLASETTQDQTASQDTAYLVNFTGTGSGAMSGPATAQRGGPMSSAGPAGSPANSAEAPTELTFDTPEGWQPASAGGMRLAAFTISNDQQQAEVTVIPLGLAAGDVLDNVNRWRQQVKLVALTDDQLAQHTRSLDVGGTPGAYVVLEGPADTEERKSILGVIVPRSDRVWFIKMMGDADLVAREQSRFEQFAQSLRLP